MFTLLSILEICIKCGKTTYLCFIEYEKAFDTVKHDKISECMEQLDMDGEYITLMINLNCNQRTEDVSSPEIHIKKEVRQGYVLSPSLFNMCTENNFRAFITNRGMTVGGTKRGMAVGGKSIYNLRYTDGSVLFSEI